MTHTKRLRLVVAAPVLGALVLAAAACGGGSTATDEATGGPVGSGTETTVEAITTTEAAPVEVEDQPGLPMANGVEIELVTPRSGGGERPMLEWTAVDGAEAYTVAVYDADGAPWWSWSGPETAVVIGGVDTDAQIGGPRQRPGPAGPLPPSTPRATWWAPAPGGPSNPRPGTVQ